MEINQKSLEVQKTSLPIILENQTLKGITLHEPKWNNSFGFEKPYWSVLWFLCMVIYLGIIFIEQIGLIWKIIGGIFIFILQVRDGLQNGFDKYLENMMTISQLKQYIEEIRTAKVQLRYLINSKTRCVNIEFPVGRIEDETKDPSIFLEKFNCLRIHCSLSYQFGDQQSQSAFEDLKQFVNNKTKNDKIKSKEEIVRCSSLKTYILAYNENTELDSILSQKIYFIFCLLGLSLLYRIYLNTRISFVEYKINKSIFVDNNQINLLQAQQSQQQFSQIENSILPKPNQIRRQSSKNEHLKSNNRLSQIKLEKQKSINQQSIQKQQNQLV